MLNKVTLIGNVGNSPETKSFPNGNRVINFTFATSESYKDKNGDKQTITQWHNVTVLNENTIKFVENYVKKGMKLYIEGSIKYEKYTAQDGSEKTATKIVVLKGDVKILSDSKKDGSFDVNENKSAENNDDIPF